MPNSLNQLLRRTFIVAAAMAAIAAVPTAHAGQVKTDTGTVFCTGFSGINVDPTGGLAISGCTTTTVAPSGGTGAGAFTISVNGAQGNPAIGSPPTIGMNSKFYMTVTRTGGGTNAASVTVHTGGGCGPTDQVYSFAIGANTAQALVQTPNNPTQCYTWLPAPTDGSYTVSGPSSLGSAIVTNVVSTIAAQDLTTTSTVTNNPPPVTNVAGCPAMDPNNTRAVSDLVLSGVARYLAPSGTIFYEQLPNPLSSAGFATGTIAARVLFNDSTASPAAGTKEIWISKCPGVFDSSVDVSNTDANPGKCYVSDSTTGTTTALSFFTAPGADPATTDNTANYYSICEAYASNGPWYINFRWTYNQSDCPWGQCGYVGQLNNTFTSP